MAISMKQMLDKFSSMEKAAQATFAAEPGALVGVDSLPGSEHDAKVPADAKKPDAEVAQGQPAGATTAEGAVNGGDAKPLNERKLEVDQPLENPQKKPEITDDALTAKEAEAHLGKLVGDLLSDIQAGKAHAQKQAQDAGTAKAEDPKTDKKDGGEKTATAKADAPKIELNDEMLSKLAAAVASFNAGRKAADDAIKQAQAAGAEKQAAAQVQSRAIAIVKEACIKAAQDAGLNPADAEAAAANAMATAGVPAEAIAATPAAADVGAATAAADAAGDVQIPDDVTEEELGEAIVDLVNSGELDADTAKALVDEIAGAGAGDAGTINEDQAAEIIANGLESGEITPEQAQVIAAAIESGAAGDAGADAGAAAADADAAAAGAADAAAAAQDASDEAQGAADAEAAVKQAAAAIRANTIQKVASHIVAKRENVKQAAAQAKQDEQKSKSPLLQKVASILTARKEAIEKANAEKQAQATVTPEQQKYLEGFCKKAAELGVDPQMLAQYMIANQSDQAK